MKNKIVRNGELYELRSAEDELLFQSESFRAVQKMFFDIEQRELITQINMAMKGE